MLLLLCMCAECLTLYGDTNLRLVQPLGYSSRWKIALWKPDWINTLVSCSQKFWGWVMAGRLQAQCWKEGSVSQYCLGNISRRSWQKQKGIWAQALPHWGSITFCPRVLTFKIRWEYHLEGLSWVLKGDLRGKSQCIVTRSYDVLKSSSFFPFPTRCQLS